MTSPPASSSGFSHGHPDHLDPASIERFRASKILLPAHVGSRIYNNLKAVRAYFKRIESIRGSIDFVTVRVGGEDTHVELANGGYKRGIIFEAPANR